MHPIDAYNHTATRAKNFLLYHDGLINTRARKVRKDWKAAFLKVMHWPASSDISRIDSKDVVLILKDGASLTPDHFSAVCLDDLLRASLTFGVSALDRYVHERVVKGIIAAYKSGSLTKQQEELMVPVTTAIAISEEVAKAKKNNKNVRTANIVRIKLQELLHKKPFQSWREIEYAFNLLGIKNLSGQLQILYGLGNLKDKKAQLSHIAARRNAIVHEGDLFKHERGGTVKAHPISRKYVEDSLVFIDELVGHLQNVA